MTRIDVFLRDRTVEATIDGGTRLRLGDDSRVHYRSAQGAISLVLERTAKHFNDSPQNIVGAIAQGRITVAIAGEARELAVAKLHLHLAFKAESAAMERIQLRVEDAGPSVYETFGFASDSVVIEATGALLDSWAHTLSNSEVEQLRWRDSEPKLRQALGMVDGKVRRAQIGIVGVTGAGKSSFINALLGRDLLPTDIGISTAAIIELVAARDRASERLEISWMKNPMIEERLRELRAASTGLLSADVDRRRKERIDALERARSRASAPRLTLEAIRDYASVRPGGLADAVERVKMYVHHPLLQHATLIDTPGMRDPDPWRRRVAFDAVGQMDAWVYLAQSGDKESSSVVEDWTNLKSQSNNGACVMLLTKMDCLGGDEDRTLAARLAAFRQHGWDRDVEHCAARGPSLLSAGAGTWQSRLEQLERTGYLKYLARVVAPNRRASSFESALLEFAENGSESIVRDYILDASGVPACARFVGRGLVELALRGRAENVRARLAEEVRACRTRLNAVVSAERAVLEKSDSLWKLRETKERRIGELRTQEAALFEHRRRIDGLIQRLQLAATTVVSAVRDGAAQFLPVAIASLQAAVAKEAEYSLSGKRSFDLFAVFDAPLAGHAGTVIATFGEAVAKACIAEGVTEAPLRSDLTAALAGYSLHDKDQFVITDHEAFLERFKTTLDRMAASADRHARASTEAIAGRARTKALELVAKARDVAGRDLVEALRAIEDLRQRIKDIATAEEDLARDAPSARALYSARVRAATEAVERVAAFERAHSSARPYDS